MITCVYQDCVLCGDRGKAIKKISAEHGLHIIFKSFASDEGKRLCKEAILHGIGQLPFYTDGEKYSTTLAEFVEKPKKTPKKTPRKTRKKTKKAEVKQGESI